MTTIFGSGYAFFFSTDKFKHNIYYLNICTILNVRVTGNFNFSSPQTHTIILLLYKIIIAHTRIVLLVQNSIPKTHNI